MPETVPESPENFAGDKSKNKRYENKLPGNNNFFKEMVGLDSSICNIINL